MANWPKGHKVVSDFIAEVLEGETARVIVMEAKLDPKYKGGVHGVAYGRNKPEVTIILDRSLPKAQKAIVIEKELGHLRKGGRVLPREAINYLAEKLDDARKKASITLSSVIIPERNVTEGILVKSASIVWARIVEELEADWTKAHQIPSQVWEEIVAGAFKKAGFEDVILTPGSGDFGRDVIACSRGVGCIKIIGSVKAYKPGHLVKHDDVRALLGVLNGEQNASKGIVATTSDFAPKIATDPFIKPYLPTRLELLNGPELQHWLVKLAKKRPRR